MPIDSVGDIQDEEDVKPKPGSTSMVELVEEIVEARGSVHAYLANHRDQGEVADDFHINADNSYIWPDHGTYGLIFVQEGDEEYWIKPEAILYLEKHN